MILVVVRDKIERIYTSKIFICEEYARRYVSRYEGKKYCFMYEYKTETGNFEFKEVIW